MTKIAIIGAGWRSGFYFRIAQMMPEHFEIVGAVARKADTRKQLEEKYGLTTYSSTSELLSHQKPDYAISSVSWASNPSVVTELVKAGVHVLCETPPAPDVQGLRDLWATVGSSDMVQVAEQYLYLPGHAARLAVTKIGTIGEITSVEVSSTHGYHVISMMRGFMQSGYGPTTVTAKQFEAPLVDPLNRDSWNQDLTPKSFKTTIALIDFGGEKSGIYNFVDNQWHNQLRHRRIVIRGSKGEIVDDQVIRLAEGPALTTSRFERYQLGHDLNLDGYDTEHISFDGTVVFKNPFVGQRMMDEEIAIAQMMVRMADWIAGNASAPYPLRAGCQDHLVSLAMDESIATGKSVTTSIEKWSI